MKHITGADVESALRDLLNNKDTAWAKTPLSGVRLVFDTSIPFPAGIDVQSNIYVNVDVINKLRWHTGEVKFLLLHEIIHGLLHSNVEHKQEMAWMQALDCHVNDKLERLYSSESSLKAAGLVRPKEITDRYQFNEPGNLGYSEYYDDIKRAANKKPPEDSPQGGADGQEGDQSEQDGQEGKTGKQSKDGKQDGQDGKDKGQDSKGQAGKQDKDGQESGKQSKPTKGKGKKSKPAAGCCADGNSMMQEVMTREQAAELQDKHNLPVGQPLKADGESCRALDLNAHIATVQWDAELAEYVGRSLTLKLGTDDYTYSVPCRKEQDDTSIIWPETIALPPDVLIIVDTSGSVNKDSVTRAIVELQNLRSILRNNLVIAYGGDTLDGVCSEPEDIVYRGCGTDMERVYAQYVEQQSQPAECCVIVTDGDCNWSGSIDIPTVIVLYPGCRTWGRYIPTVYKVIEMDRN